MKIDLETASSLSLEELASLIRVSANGDGR